MDFESAQFKRRLSETIMWCAEKGLTARAAESSKTNRRRALFQQSEDFLRQARDRASRSWFHSKPSATKQWAEAMTLLKEIRDSLEPMEHRLRSAALEPKSAPSDLRTDTQWEQAVAEVAEQRAKLAADISAPACDVDESRGRLLLYVPTESLMDGAAQNSTKGFFDVDNVPPWDLWIDFSDRTLVSWVPSALEEVAQMGIDVNPEGCIRWAD
jgi:hypothetical protein